MRRRDAEATIRGGRDLEFLIAVPDEYLAEVHAAQAHHRRANCGESAIGADDEPGPERFRAARGRHDRDYAIFGDAGQLRVETDVKSDTEQRVKVL